MYQVYKLFHVLAVILFLGNIIAGLYWKFLADRTLSAPVIAHTFKGIIHSDRWFTIPSVFLITIAGILTAIKGGMPILGTGWILWSLVLFTISGLVFILRVVPLQERIANLTQAGVNSGAFDWSRYKSMSLAWEIWGGIALITPLGAVVLMVLKPGLPAF